jgi:hypothetical protein
VKLMATETEVLAGFAEPAVFSRVIERQHT